jgi:heavy metal sensor kinase
MMRKSLRTRLTFWNVSVLAALLVLPWGGTDAFQFWQLRNQLDHFDVEEIETVEGWLFFTPDGMLRLRDGYHNHSESKERIESFLEVLSPEGSLLFRNERLGGRALGGTPLNGEGVGGYSERSDRLSDGTHVRLASRAHVLDGHRLLIRLGQSEEPIRARLYELLLPLIFVLPVALAVAAFVGYSSATRALSPIEQMVRRAEQIRPERLSERLPTENVDDELGRLAREFNGALARLELAFNQLRRFSSDCSHELRAPVAMIRIVGEVALQESHTCEEYQDIIGRMLQGMNRLTSLIEALLTIARADSGFLKLQRTVVPVMAIAREAAGLFDVLIEEKSLSFVFEGDEHAEVEADRMVLTQALANVIHNAVKYSPVGETVSVRIRSGDPDRVTVEIQDRGPGIPREDRVKVFERFYRVDKAHSRESCGAGLGLSIAKWAVEAHGGSIELGSVNEQGCTFLIGLPRVQSAVSQIETVSAGRDKGHPL